MVPLITFVIVLLIRYLSQFVRVEELHEEWTITEVGDLKGWEIYTLQDGQKKPLTQSQENGWEFDGLDFPGQVYYMSRVLDDKISNPTMNAGSIGFRVSVFIDDHPVYLHPYASDAQIGHLYYTGDTIISDSDSNINNGASLSLPALPGQTMTLAIQSLLFPEEELNTKITKTLPITFYNSFLDENTVLSSIGANSIFPIEALGGITILLLLLYIFFLIAGQNNHRILLLAMASFGWVLYHSSTIAYGQLGVTLEQFHRQISILSLLVFYAFYMPKRSRWFWVITSIYAFINIVLFINTDTPNIPYITLLNTAETISFIALCICMVIEARRKNQFFRWLSWLSLSAFSILVILYLHSLTNNTGLSTMIHNDITSLLSDGTSMHFSNWIVLFLFFAGFILNFITFIHSIVNKDIAIKTLEMKNAYEAHNVKQLKQGIDATKRLRHEVFHHLNSMQFLYDSKDYDRLGAYIEQLSKERTLLEPLQYSNNSLVNAIVAERFDFAKKHNIKIDYTLLIPENINMKDTHLVSFLTNLLDNAMEAAKAVEPAENRMITLKMVLNDNKFLSIYCQNTKSGKTVIDPSGNISSTKKSTLHGFGLQIMQDITNSYHSTLVIEDTESTFTVKTNLLLSSIS